MCVAFCIDKLRYCIRFLIEYQVPSINHNLWTLCLSFLDYFPCWYVSHFAAIEQTHACIEYQTSFAYYVIKTLLRKQLLFLSCRFEFVFVACFYLLDVIESLWTYGNYYIWWHHGWLCFISFESRFQLFHQVSIHSIIEDKYQT